MVKTNTLKEKLKNNELVLGTWSSTSSANIINVIGTTNLDFVVIDLEHASMSYETVENMVRAAEATNISPIVRVGNDDSQTILRALETGPKSIMVPHVDTAEKAEKIAKACKYFPEGNRGLSPYTRIHNFTHNNIDTSLQSENKSTMVGILVEGKDGLSNLDEIVKVKGIDLIYLGLFDICQSVGLPGKLDHPKVIHEIKRCCKLIQSNGKAAGSMATSVEYIKMLQEVGYTFIAYLNDAAAMKSHFEEVMLKINRS